MSMSISDEVGILRSRKMSISFLTTGVAYSRAAQNENVPVVNVGNRAKPSYLLAQCCIVMPGQSSQSKLDSNQAREMIAFAVKKPYENADFILKESPSVVGLSPDINVKMVSDSPR